MRPVGSEHDSLPRPSVRPSTACRTGPLCCSDTDGPTGFSVACKISRQADRQTYQRLCRHRPKAVSVNFFMQERTREEDAGANTRDSCKARQGGRECETTSGSAGKSRCQVCALQPSQPLSRAQSSAPTAPLFGSSDRPRDAGRD